MFESVLVKNDSTIITITYWSTNTHPKPSYRWTGLRTFPLHIRDTRTFIFMPPVPGLMSRIRVVDMVQKQICFGGKKKMGIIDSDSVIY